MKTPDKNFCTCRDSWVPQSVKRKTLDFSLCLDLRVVALSPALGSKLGVEPT